MRVQENRVPRTKCQVQLDPKETTSRAVRGIGSSSPLILFANVLGAQQARALTYLAASQVLLQQPADAAATFRRLLFLDPRTLPDSLQFPPEVRRVYADTRERTKVLSAGLPPRSDLAVGRDTLKIRVYASSFHYLTATLEGPDGTTPVALYNGPIRDSLALPWDARTGDGAAPKPGPYRLHLVSSFPQGQVQRSLLIPLEISASAQDTLTYPAPPDSLLPERTSSRPGLRAFGAGLLAGGLVLLLPPLAGASGDAGAGRFAVTGVLSVAAVAGLLIPAAFLHARAGHFDRHQRLARWALPIWLFVAVSGLAVYIMAGHLFPIATS